MCRQFIFWFSAAILLSNLTSFTYGQTWKELLDQADSLSEAQNQDSAITIGKLALEEAKAEFGAEDTTVALVLHNLGVYSDRGGDYSKAEELFKRALAIREKVLGPEHLDVSKTLNNLGVLYWYQGKYAESELHHKRVLAIREKALGPGHPDVARSLNNLGLAYQSQGRYAESESAYKQALVIREKTLDPEHEDMARSLTNLGWLLLAQGKYIEAESLLKRSLAIWEKARGPEHRETSRALTNLAVAYVRLGKYSESELTFRRALTIKEKVLGPEHIDVARGLINIGAICTELGKYAECESANKRALALIEKILGPDHQLVGTILANLGMLYKRQNKYADGESALKKALAIWEKLLGPKHPDVAECLSILGSIYAEQGKYAEAESFYQRALSIQEEVLGSEHPDFGGNLSRLACLRRSQGRFADAESLHQQALSIEEKAHGPEHPEVALSLIHLAILYRDIGKYAKAEKLFQRGLAIREKTLGDNHYLVARNLQYFSRLRRLQQNINEALKMAEQANQIRRKNFIDNAMVLSEKDALSYSQFQRHSVDNYLSCFAELGSTDSEIVNTAASIILSGKGQVSDGIFERQKTLVSETDLTTLALAESFRLTRFQLSKLFVQGPPNDLDSYRARVDSLTRVSNELEADLSRHSASFRRQQDYRNISVDRITSLLPEKSILVEYLKYDYLQLKPDSAIPHYLVVVMERGEQPVITDLGEATDVDTLVSEYREHMLRVSSQRHMPLKKDQEAYGIIARKLYDAVIRPVEDYLSGKDLVFIAADGGLNLVSYSGLIDDEGRYLIEKFPIHYFSSGRELIRLKDHLARGEGLLAMGDPDYDATAITRKERPQVAQYASTDGDNYAPRSRRSSCEFFSGMSRLDSLPGSRWEIDSITKSWQTNSDEPVVAYFGPQASEDMFKAEAPGKRVIHLATHGYYISGQCEALRRTGRSDIQGSYAGENPLLQSGLFLAGANLHGEGADSAGIEDGVLTAYEVSAMDLQGTELVVLSACETGLGEVKQGEGVYGLRRAFQMAGARTVVSALWPVPDKQTATIMSELYSATGESLPTKLRRIQLDRIASLRLQQLADHPYSWGAFIALGDWR